MRNTKNYNTEDGTINEASISGIPIRKDKFTKNNPKQWLRKGAAGVMLSLASLGLVFGLDSCAPIATTESELGPRTVSAGNQLSMQQVYQGTIESIRLTNIVPNKKYNNTSTDTINLGGYAGGLLGAILVEGINNSATNEKVNSIAALGATIGGMVIGDIIGKKVSQKIKKEQQEAYMLVIKLNDGTLVSVIQPPTVDFSPGESIYIIRTNDGYTRVEPTASQ